MLSGRALRRVGKQAESHSVRFFAGQPSRDADVASIDLRSDTVTQPSSHLRLAMSQAEVGDDVFNEDPSVHKLQEWGAALLGKEAGLFLPSSTMSNLIAVGVHCRRGEEAIVGDQSHMFLWEGAGASALMGVSLSVVTNEEDGTLGLDAIRSGIRPDDIHCPRTSLLCLENTQNMCGGRAIPAYYMKSACQLAKEEGLKVHVDGSRLMNAAVALGVQPKSLVEGADSVNICLSKGLGAPAGSLLLGEESFIAEARRLRKTLGGGMRQSGVLAAAGVEALVNNYSRLADDHRNAQALSAGLAALPGVAVDPHVQTNIVYFDVTSMDPGAFVARLAEEHNVLIGGGYGVTRVRAVTHMDVTSNQIDEALDAMRTVLC
ncbi:unnamed protein product [Chrysoparadoxa australica]